MSRVTRALSLVLLAAGIIFIFAGLNLAIGWSVLSVVSTAVVVAALVYTGAIWFGAPVRRTPPAPDTVVVFDQSLRVVTGALCGVTLTSCFPASMRNDIETHCTAALGGVGARFSCIAGRERLQFDAVPVRAADSRIVYGLLMTDVKLTSPTDVPARIV